MSSGAVPRLSFELSQAILAKFMAGATLGALTLFFLSTGRKRNDPGRLFWAVVCALAALAVLTF
ncbi:MAG TPA: hypothetical protein DCM05_11055 [Elusimicrobia bacterium]|nr:hypothetical protein [Elusimicrobiota bacterium]